MNNDLKHIMQRLLGVVILLALGIVFIPMLLNGPIK